MQHHIFEVFKHEKTFGAVVLVIRHSCYEIQTYCYTFQLINTHDTLLYQKQISNIFHGKQNNLKPELGQVASLLHTVLLVIIFVLVHILHPI